MWEAVTEGDRAGEKYRFRKVNGHSTGTRMSMVAGKSCVVGKARK